MDTRQFYFITVVQIVAVCGLLWFMFTMSEPWGVQRALGTILIIAGLSGIAAARYQLGRSFAIKAEAHQLVTRGIYAKIRNPIYVSGIVFLAGLVLILHRPQLWLAMPVIIVMQTVRARREARVLEAAFGEAYREYRRQTWF